ncbi:MAG: hypothetical protein J5552_12830 [Prevotella sp.]|nr:hypothetical protein [Prevotella sp.]
MDSQKQIFSLRWIVFTALFFIHHSLFVNHVAAQTEVTDSIVMAIDSMYNAMDMAPLDTINPAMDDVEAMEATMETTGRDWATWRPDPQRALWLALVIPGGGQIYNRKFWKLPIVYGGFVGCVYAMRWNNMMYKDYAQAYRDIMDDDPNTASYKKFEHLGQQIDRRPEYWKNVFKKRKDRFRRWRDLSFFVMLGVYAVSVIDAYVDAELSVFDISKDLSLKLRPAVIKGGLGRNPLADASLGASCVLDF